MVPSPDAFSTWILRNLDSWGGTFLYSPPNLYLLSYLKMSEQNTGGSYIVGALIFGVICFGIIWLYAIGQWGLLFGLIFGWIPALIGGVILGAIWPIALLALACLFILVLKGGR